MVKGIRLVLSGIVAIALGVVLYTLPKGFDLAWYHPLPAFPAGVLLIVVGVYTIKAARKNIHQSTERGAEDESAWAPVRSDPSAAPDSGE